MTFVFFNLLVNSIFSLLIGLMLISLFVRFFRVETGRWKLFLLSTPFVKIVWDVARGVPEKSVLFSGVDPFSLPPKHQVVSLGAGFDGWTPFVSAVFSVNALDGKAYNSSVGDYLSIWTQRTFGGAATFAVVASVLAVSMALLARRALKYFLFERRRIADRRGRLSLQAIEVGWRTIDVYVSPGFSGSPFTGGVCKPYVCLPEDAALALSPAELVAVIAHEASHVRGYDLVMTVLIQALGDVFWFVPGYRWLSRKLDRLREIVADGSAVAAGADPGFLASALLKLNEISAEGGALVLYSAFIREKSLLKERVERLVGLSPAERPRFGWRRPWVRCASTACISVVVLNSVFGGNYKNQDLMKTPEWFENLFKVSCVCVGPKLYAKA